MATYLNRRQVLERLSVSPYKLGQLVADKKLSPPIRLEANLRGRYYLAEEVEALARVLDMEREQAPVLATLKRNTSYLRRVTAGGEMGDR